jgi:hypothetical protein
MFTWPQRSPKKSTRPCCICSIPVTRYTVLFRKNVFCSDCFGKSKTPERLADQARNKYKRHREKLCKYQSAYYHKTLKNDPEKLRRASLAKARWRIANADKLATYFRNRNAKLKGSGGSHSLEDIADIWDRQGEKCAISDCNFPIASSGKNKYHVDHVKAVANGGSNDKSNLQILCGVHNRQKRDRDEYEWAQEYGLLFF